MELTWILPALTAGEIDVYPEYVGTALEFLNDGAGEATGDTAASLELLRGYFSDEGVDVLEPSAAEDKNGLVVRPETASELGLARVSDLADVAGDLTYHRTTVSARGWLALSEQWFLAGRVAGETMGGTPAVGSFFTIEGSERRVEALGHGAEVDDGLQLRLDLPGDELGLGAGQGQLGGGLAHQLRNSATGCRMALELHRRECPRSEDCENLDVAVRLGAVPRAPGRVVLGIAPLRLLARDESALVFDQARAGRNRAHPDDRDRVLEAYQRTVDEGTAFEIDFRVPWPDGSIGFA